MKQLVFLAALLYAGAASAQTDSFEIRELILKEVRIENSPKHLLDARLHQPKNVQTSTEKILEGVGGVQLIRRGNFAPEPVIRGFHPAQISTTIDGMAMFGACTDRMDPISSYIEPNNLQGIEVNFGGSEETDGNSIGGGFDFKLKQPKINAAKPWSGLAGVGYETNGHAAQTLANVQYSRDKWAALATGIFRKSGNYRASKGREIPYSQYTKWNGSLGAKYRLSPNASIAANYLQDEGYDIGYPALTMDVEYAKAKIGSVTYLYHSAIKALQHLEWKAYFNSVNHAMDDTKRPAEEVFMHMDMPGTSFTAGTYAATKWNWGRHGVKARISLYTNRLHAEMTMYPAEGAPMYMLTLPDAQRTMAALQVSDTYHAGKNFRIEGGAGANFATSDLYSDEGSKMVSGIFGSNLRSQQFSPNLYIQPQWQQNRLTAYLYAALNSRTPALQELYGFYLFNRMDGYDYLGNPQLKQERAWNVSPGIRYQADGFVLDANAFYRYIPHYIAGVSVEGYSVMTHGANGVKKYENLPYAQLKGGAISATFSPSEKWRLNSQNSFTYGEDNEGHALPMIPPFESLNEVTFAPGGFHISWLGRFAAAQKRVSGAKYGESVTPSYFVMDLKVAKEFKFGNNRLNANIGVENLLDTDYVQHLDIMKVSRPGRNFVFQVNWLW